MPMQHTDDPPQLQAALERFLLMSGSVAMGRFSADGMLVSVNARFQRLLPESLPAARLPELVINAQREEMERLVAGGPLPEQPRRVHFAAGAQGPVTLLATWVRDGDDLVLLGETPVAELEAAQSSLAKLAARAADLAREDAKKSAALEKALEDLQRQHEELERAQRHVEQLSREDSLTGLLNRRWLEESLEVEIERARRHGTPLSIIMLDVDRFKTINDSHGHIVGDRVLTAVARCVRREVRLTDLVGRFGGDELMVVLPGSAAEPARALAERLRASVRQIPTEFRPDPVTGSFGVTQWQDEDTKTTFVARADEALYAAKGSGRDRVELR